MTPVKVPIVINSFKTFKDVLACEVWPVLYSIVLVREFPAALILPLKQIFKPLEPISFIINEKYWLNKYFKNLKIDLVFQKLILCIMAFNHVHIILGSCKFKARCIICRASSKKNLCPNLRS